jgi:hypothetical protein
MLPMFELPDKRSSTLYINRENTQSQTKKQINMAVQINSHVIGLFYHHSMVQHQVLDEEGSLQI